MSDARAIESLDLLFELLAPEHMAFVQTLAAAGLVTLRKAARRVGRDLRAVRSDVCMLLKARVLRKDDEGRTEFPCTAVRDDFMLETAA